MNIMNIHLKTFNNDPKNIDLKFQLHFHLINDPMANIITICINIISICAIFFACTDETSSKYIEKTSEMK